MRSLKIILLAFLFALVLGLAGCGGHATATPQPTPTPVLIEQWASAAEASSEFAWPDWSALQVLGEPDVTQCEDDPHAWASARGNGLEWLELTFAQPVYPRELRIHQVIGRGAIARVLVRDEAGELQLLWEGEDIGDTCPGVLRIPLPRTAYRVTRVRIEIDESRTGFWDLIDAVQLIGEK